MFLLSVRAILVGSLLLKKGQPMIKSSHTLGRGRGQISTFISLIKVVNNLLCRYFR